MNRNDEFTEFMKELDQSVPEVSESIKKGSRRKARKKFLYQPFLGLAAVFMLFVLSVNLCAPVAKAFSNLPLLKDLTKAVTFSKSLTSAVENDYVREMELMQTKDGVTVEIVSAIVDQGNLSVFYRFASEQYESLQANCTVFDENGEYMLGYTSNERNDFNSPNEEVRCVSTCYLWVMGNAGPVMPEKVRFHMVVWDKGASEEEFLAKGFDGEHYVYDLKNEAEKYSIAEFDFVLELTPESIPDPITYEVNRTLEIENSKFTVTDILVYPTYMRVIVESAVENEGMLRNMNYYVESEKGERFYPVSGLVPGKKAEKETSCIYYFDAESPYFANAESLKLVVTGAEWTEPEKERTRINLVTGEASNLPENVTLKQVYEKAGTTYLEFEQCENRSDERTEERLGQYLLADPFTETYYDGDGNARKMAQYHLTQDGEADVVMELKVVLDEIFKPTGIRTYEIRLNNYLYEEIYLENAYSDVWVADEGVSLEIK